MNTNKPTDQSPLARIRHLKQTRQEILALPAEDMLEKILTSAQPAALVHSFKEEDLYLLLQDIGPEGALPLLGLASDKQWEYILDLEAWDKDRLSPAALTQWLSLLFQADPRRLVKWGLEKKADLLQYYLFKNLEIRIRETDQLASDFSGDFFTEDDTFYVRLIDPPADQDEGQTAREQRQAFLTTLIRRLSQYDHVAYQNLLIESGAILPAETEEEAYRLRNVRLAEKGFLPFDEAVGVYQPLKISEFEAGPTKHIPTFSEDTVRPTSPLYPVKFLPDDNRFTKALQLIDVEVILEQIQSEFAGLCNQVIAADHHKIANKEDLGQIVRKVCGFINLGLAKLSQAKNASDAGYWAAQIKRLPLIRFFRLGYGMVLDLKWQAEKWHDRSWFAARGLPLSFWDEEWLGVLGGLLLKRPLFFDNYRNGELYRNFATFEDVQSTAQNLEQMMAFDTLLRVMDLKPGPLAGHRFITYKNFLLTLWGRDYLNLAPEPAALSMRELRDMFSALFIDAKEPSSRPAFKINPAMRPALLAWLAAQSGLQDEEISERIGAPLEALFTELENEYGQVAPRDLDPRYILHFILQQ
jgi:hypothetical protein